MARDPILDEIARVRKELVERYGGLDGYFKYVAQLDRARLRSKRSARHSKSKVIPKSNS